MVVQMMMDEVFPDGDLLKHTDGLKRLLDNLDTEEAKHRYVITTTLSMPLEDLKKEKFVPSKWLVAHECEVIKNGVLRLVSSGQRH